MTDPNAPQPAVRIERNFDAPIDLIWQMWTTPEHFAAWYGPPGATVVVEKMDVRVGGRRLVGMEVVTANGTMKMWFAGEHLEVIENRRLAYTESMADETGNIVSAAAMGMPADHPTATAITVELEVVGGRTRMVMIYAGIPEDSPGATGWAMALDKLGAYISERQER